MFEDIAVFGLRMFVGAGVLWLVFKFFQGLYFMLFMDTRPTLQDIGLVVGLLAAFVGIGYGAYLLGGFILGLTG